MEYITILHLFKKYYFMFKTVYTWIIDQYDLKIPTIDTNQITIKQYWKIQLSTIKYTNTKRITHAHLS